MNETETKNLNNFWDQYQKLNNAWDWDRKFEQPKKNDPKVTWGNTCGQGRKVLFKRSFQAAEEEEDSKDEDDDDNPRRRAVRRFDSDSLIQSIAASTQLLKARTDAYVWNWILGIPTKYKKMSLIKGKTSKKLNFLPKKDRPLFEDFVLWPKPKVSETLWAGTPPSTCHESSYPATGKAPSGERNFSPSCCKRWTFKTSLLFCECLGDTRS